MRSVMAVSLPMELLRKLSREAKQIHSSRSEIVRRALQQHFFVRDFSSARNRILGELNRKGISKTEEQIFDEIS